MKTLKTRAVAAAVGTLAVLGATATSASADGNTWRYIDGTSSGMIRHYVTGSGTTINSQTAQIELFGGDMICKFYINWVYLDSAGKPWYTERALTNTGCAASTAPAGSTSVVAKAYRGHGTAKLGHACAYVFTNNAYRGRACVRIN